MSAMTIADAWPRDSDRPLTVDDLERLPDDGNRYELLDGVLIVSPAPFVIHQLVISTLHLVLEGARPSRYQVLPGIGILMAEHSELIPDISVIRTDTIEDKYQTTPPELVIEVASGRTGLYDRNGKKEAYARFGVPDYWIVTPDKDKPELTAYRLHDDRYVEIAHVGGDELFTAARPFPVTIRPADLVVLR